MQFPLVAARTFCTMRVGIDSPNQHV